MLFNLTKKIMFMMFSNLLGQYIAEKILEQLEKAGLDMANCRGQAYDGASNMSGTVKGCSTLIRQQYPKAIYQHCRSHLLNLAIFKVSKSISEISECYYYICFIR